MGCIAWPNQYDQLLIQMARAQQWSLDWMSADEINAKESIMGRFFFPILLLCLLSGDALCQQFRIPDLQELPRIDRRSPRPGRDVLRNSAFILKLNEHRPAGDQYVILTDHTASGFLDPLQKLAEHRNGSIINVADLGEIYQTQTLQSLRNQLRQLKPKFIAIAPRMESYRENMLLGVWELISSLDEDKYLDVYPGLLLASTPQSFQRLIDRTIHFQSISQKELKPMAISQVPSNAESRSLQKAGILRNVFGSYGIPTPVLAIYTPAANAAPVIEGDLTWEIRLKEKGRFVTSFEPDPRDAIQRAQLVIMHGHGIPGMSCSIDVDGIPTTSSNQIVLSGSCFGAVPAESDFPTMTSAPGGYQVKPRQAFATRYVDRGATVFFGHMRLSSGFPHLFPVLEKWMAGKSVGQAYQELINGLIDMRGFQPGKFVVKNAGQQRRIPQNALLYVVLGDPALIPLRPLIKMDGKK
jgi:hypothetical protein